MYNNSTIVRLAGSLSAAPTISSGSAINVYYDNSSAITTGPELPSGGSLNNLTIAGSATVTLQSGISPVVNDNLTLTSGTLAAGQRYADGGRQLDQQRFVVGVLRWYGDGGLGGQQCPDPRWIGDDDVQQSDHQQLGGGDQWRQWDGGQHVDADERGPGAEFGRWSDHGQWLNDLRSAGSISGVAPTVGSGNAINVMYTNSSAVTTGLELPSGSSSLNNLTIGGNGTVTLQSGIHPGGEWQFDIDERDAGGGRRHADRRRQLDQQRCDVGILRGSAVDFGGTSTLGGTSATTTSTMSRSRLAAGIR